MLLCTDSEHMKINQTKYFSSGNLTVMVFEYLILISIDFLRFDFSLFSVAYVSVEKIYQVRQKYFAARGILGVSRCGKTPFLVLEI